MAERKLKYVLKFEPKLMLPENYAIHTPTRREFNQLMRVLEVGGVEWQCGDLPTEHPRHWDVHRGQTCVLNSERDRLGYSYLRESKERGKLILIPMEFYEREQITPQMLKEISQYFRSILTEEATQ